MHNALRIFDGLIWVDHGAANGGHVGAVRWVLGVEDLLIWAEAAVGRTVSWEGSYTVVTGGEEDRVALQTEFHELVALALGVADREVGFGLTVGCADDVGGLVDTTLEFAFYLVNIGFLLG
jgi:hypothetical protein